MPTKRLLLLLPLLFVFAPKAQAADIWFKQAASGAGTGATCTDARALSSHAIGDDVGDNILHLCPGTFTGTAGATGFTALASGTSGHPITIKFETGAIMSAPYWSAAIDLSNKSWWVVDGGTICGYVNGADVACNGTIINTASGTGLANINPTCPAHGDSNCNGVHVGVGSSHIEIKNLEIGPLYLRTTLTTNANGGKVKAIYSEPGTLTDIHIHNNQITDAQAAIFFAYCGLTNFEVDHNTTNNHVWGVGMLDSNSGCTVGTGSIHHNHIGDFLKWSAPMGGDVGFHFDGIILSSNESSTVFSNTDLYDNFYDGAMDINGTGFIYLTSEHGTMITGMRIYNEVIHPRLPGNSNGFPGDGLITLGFTSASSVFNTTIISCYATDSILIRETGTKVLAFRNNIISGDTCGSPFVAIHNKNGANLGGGIFTNNNYFNLNASRAFETGDGTNFYASLAAWQAACNCDSSSVVANPNLNASFVPGGGSSAINAGLNLSPLNITNLNIDKNGSPRPSTGPWTVGAVNPGNTPPAAGLTITPNTINFGSSAIGVGSATQTATITSNGTATATLGTIVAVFSDPQFARTGGTCTPSQSLAVGASCTVIAQFTPTSAGVKNANMVVGGNGGNATASIGLSGTGTGGTVSMSAAPATWDFGSVTQGQPSTPKQFVITNNGVQVTLATPVTSFSGTNPSDFALGTGGGDTCSSGLVMNTGDTCTKTVQGTPTATGSRTATVTLSATTGAATAALTMTGTAISNPSILITPRPLAFANTNVGSTNSQVATATNNGNVSLTISGVSKSGTNAADLVIDSTTCSGTIAVAGTCTVNVTFHATIAGAETANLTVTTTVTSNTDVMNGTGVAVATPGIGLSPSGGVLFGSQIVGTNSSIQTVTVNSTGTGNLTLNTPYFTLSGTNAADVTNTGAGTCSNGKIIGTGSSCTVTLRFNPASAGARSATLNIAGNASASLPLSGTGIAAVVTVSAVPSPLPFGSVTQGTGSAIQTVTITNIGNVAGTLATPFKTITGTNSTDFTDAGTGTCANGTVLAPGGTCTVKLIFTPATLGAESAVLTVSTTGAVSVTDNLTGNGVAPTVPSISISPNPGAFGSVNLGGNTSLTLTIANNGTAVLNFSAPFYSITGTNASDWTRTGGTCADSGTVGTSASCTIILQFTPGAAGARVATLNIFGNASKTAQLTGTGIATAPVLSPSPSPRDFGVVVQNTPSGAMTVTVQNVGTASATLSPTFHAITGANAADFVRSGGTCGSGTVLAVSGTCTILLTFTPSSTAGETATLTVFANGGVTGTDILTGTGQAQGTPPAPSPAFLL